MKRPTIGDEELRALNFITEHAPISVGEVFRSYGAANGLSRSTILTIMERLRKKGYLNRQRQDGGAYVYSLSVPRAELLQKLVSYFVERTLEGSVSPFTVYLSRRGSVTPGELEELKALVRELDARQKEGEP
ncbi:MAG TPA: BlaI/MecI/CopY family transcriptional regulator [Armatimonadota bacterium]|nr:BlaI/MecI/CopY family transcriptional regulator [Armatimonadota bacterium]